MVHHNTHLKTCLDISVWEMAHAIGPGVELRGGGRGGGGLNAMIEFV